MAILEYNEIAIAGFCVVYLDEDADDCVVMCDSFAQMQEVARQKEKEGYLAKTFIECEIEPSLKIDEAIAEAKSQKVAQ